MDLSWRLDPLVILGVAALAALYARGARPPLARASLARAVSFYGGLAVILAALISPLAAMAEQLFLAHMVQHLLLLMVAVPLALLGAPSLPLVRGLPRQARLLLLRPFSRGGVAHALLGAATNPLVALGTYVALLSLWHVPALYDAALENEALHVLEHATFLVIATLFWGQVIDPFPFRAPLHYPLRIVYLFVATAHNTVLGGILSFAEPTLYAHYASLTTRLFGISAIADQQWGGVIMWVPGGLVHLLAISLVFAAWLNSEDRAGEAAAHLTPSSPRAHDPARPADSAPEKIESRPLPDHVLR